MKHSIALLKKELAEWEEHNDSEKEFFKGEENDPMAIKSFNECFENILDLQQAIDVLEKQAKVFSSNSVLSEVLPVPRKCKYCKQTINWGTTDEDCYMNGGAFKTPKGETKWR